MSSPRVNRDGHPCPDWCVTDHGKYAFHGAGQAEVPGPDYRTFHVRAILYAAGGPAVQVAGGGIVYVPARDAGDLAVIVEELATATPDQHHALAAAIRDAAKIIKGDDHDGIHEDS